MCISYEVTWTISFNYFLKYARNFSCSAVVERNVAPVHSTDIKYLRTSVVLGPAYHPCVLVNVLKYLKVQIFYKLSHNHILL